MLADRIKCTTSTTGTGTITLSATGVRDTTNGDYLAPAESLAALEGRLTTYWIINGGANGTWAKGRGLLSTNGLSLQRDTYERSWNGSALATTPLGLSGTSTVFISPDCKDLQAASIGQTIAARMGAYLA